jgi:hypothetical protein
MVGILAEPLHGIGSPVYPRRGAVVQNRTGMPTVRIEVYVQPGASKTELAGLHDGLIKIRIAAPALENAANLALIEFVAKRLGIAKRFVRLASGSTSRRKVLDVDGASAAEIAERLRPA